MDTEKEIQHLQRKITELERLLYEMAVPIIPSILAETILVPIAGYVGHDRFSHIRTRVLEYVYEYRTIERVVFDFTGVEIEHIQEADYEQLAISIGELNKALKLMGIRPIYVGFNPRLVKDIVHAGVHVDIETFINFKTAIAMLFEEIQKSTASAQQPLQ